MLPSFLPYSTQNITNEDKDSILEALFSTHLTQGAKTQEFQNALASYLGAREVFVYNAATSALYVAFSALKSYIEEGLFRGARANAERLEKARAAKRYSVLTTPLSFVATSNMMLANGLRPIFSDIQEDGNLNPDLIEENLEEDTVAICSIDYAGKSVDRDAIGAIARKHGLLWISDSSHAFGASFRGAKVGGNAGSQADMTIFSFHAVKPLTTAEGGALATNDKDLARLASNLGTHGIEKKSYYDYDCLRLGFNFRLSELGAALGLPQLKRLESFMQKREAIANFYNDYFKDQPYFHTPRLEPHLQSTHHLYPIKLKAPFSQNRTKLLESLLAENIGAHIHYKPIYHFSLYKQPPLSYKPLAATEAFYEAQLSIPCHQNMDLDLASEVAKSLLDELDKLR